MGKDRLHAGLMLFFASAYMVGAYAFLSHTGAAQKGDWSPLRETCYQRPDASPEFAAACKPGAKVAILGDSMALAWYPLVDVLYGDVALYSRGACPVQVGYPGRNDDNCPRFIANAIREARKADVVFVAGAWNTLDRKQLDATLKALEGRKVYVIGLSPRLKQDAPGCVQTHGDCAVPVPSPGVTNTLRALATKHGADVIDPVPFLCSNTCDAVKDGMILYWDRNHISATAAVAYAQSVESSLRR